MSVLIVGANGSMGKRYQAILRYLGRDFTCVDEETQGDKLLEVASRHDGIIVSTPTDTHVKIINLLSTIRKPILCEKPVSKNPAELTEMFFALRRNGTPFRMMFQYSMLAPRSAIGPSHYDYFRHGSDGLIWDCMQIISLARGSLELRETSPVWSCKLNGKLVNLNYMDAAYIAYVQKWFTDPYQDLGYLTEIHEKVNESYKKVTNA